MFIKCNVQNEDKLNNCKHLGTKNNLLILSSNT